LHDIDKFEENNPFYSINVFYLVPARNDKEQITKKLDSLYILEYNYQREYLVNLILFTKREKDLKNYYNINKILLKLNIHYCFINGKSE